MNKKSVSAVLISAIVFSSALFSAAPATASDDDEGDEIELYQEVGQDHDDLEKKVRDEIKRKYGPREHLQMPPLVVRPKKIQANLGETPKTQSSKTQKTELEDDSDDSAGASVGGASLSGPESSEQNSTSSGSNSEDDQVFGSASLSNLEATIPQVSNTTNTVTVVPKTAENITVFVGEPIEISSIRYTLKTPAEKFVEAASFGLIAMLISALGLAAVVSSRAIRRK